MNFINDPPKGGIVPVSRKVMNLSYVLKQAARRFPKEIGLVWGKTSWNWIELNKRVDAMANALASRQPHSIFESTNYKA